VLRGLGVRAQEERAVARVSDERAFAERVAQAVLANSPFVLCCACLALKLGLTEKDTRDAAQIVVSRPGFGLDRRSCYGCDRIESVLIGER
jgi:hypothetical protein